MDSVKPGNDMHRLIGNATLRIPKPTLLPADSAMGKTRDLVESLTDLEVVQILPNEGLGRFGLYPSQLDAANIFVPIELLQDALSRSALQHKLDSKQANVIFLSGKPSQTPPTETVTRKLEAGLRPSLEDFGLRIKHVKQSLPEQKPVFEYYSLSSDRMVLSSEVVHAVSTAFPGAKEVFTYLANDIRTAEQQSGIPFSMVAAIDFDQAFQLEDQQDQPIKSLAENEIVLNQWAAFNIGSQVGDRIVLTYFEPETTHGDQIERSAEFTLKAVAKLTEPSLPYQVRRRNQVTPAVFDLPPTVANDPDLTPEVPGITDAESIERWDLPFATADKIRPADDEYWDNYRTTPKAFVSLAAGKKLWSSRFGQTTSFRIPISAGSEEQVKSKLLDQFVADDTQLGFELIPIKRNGLKASAGSTPFGFLFLALSMFVIASALILVALLFRLSLQQRAAEIGVLLAMGFRRNQVSRLWIYEMLIVATLGGALGILIGTGYAAVMIYGLKTWWVGAISRPFLQLYINPLTLLLGWLCGLIVCLLTIVGSIRRAGRYSVNSLLGGSLDRPNRRSRGQGKLTLVMALAMTAVALILAIVASRLGGEPQAGAFMGSGFLMLTALLMLTFRFLTGPARRRTDHSLSLPRLAGISGRRNPLRSTLTIGLVGVASFLIMSVSSFRLSPTLEGTAGFDWIAKSDQPIFADLGSADQQKDLLGERLSDSCRFFSIRYKPGQDASCNNLYQSTQPQVLGVSDAFVESFDPQNVDKFRWASTIATDQQQIKNPWRMLYQTSDDGAIPVIIDKNTANYSLKIFATGGDYEVHYDSGQQVKFRVVGFLENSVLQGSLIISEANFVKAFPRVSGYRYFLINGSKQDADILEDRLSDQGFDARSAPQLLAEFQKVQNTYISTFQSLGALGLLLGTLGLAAVQIRSVLEQRKELGLMRSVGFSRGQLSRMVLMENAWLLLLGLGVGISSALFATLPHYWIGGASVPWTDLALLFAIILAAGLLAAYFASRSLARMPLIQSLR